MLQERKNLQQLYEPLHLVYSERQLLRQVYGPYNEKAMIAKYEALLAFNKAYEQRTKIVQEPLPTKRSSGSEPLLAMKPTGLLRRVTFDVSLPTIDEKRRVPSGRPAEKLELPAAVEPPPATSTGPQNLENGPPLRTHPTVVMTWNCNGVGPLLKKTDYLRDLNTTLQQRNVDVLFIQEVKLRAYESGDQGRVSRKNESLLAAFLLYFPEYQCVLSLDRERKYAGQMLLYHQAVKSIIIAEFAHVKCVGVYVPCISDLDSKRLARRRDFDKQSKNYLAMSAKTSVKPTIFCGDMNAVEDLGQTTHDKEHWRSLIQNKLFNVPTNTENHQWAGTSDPEIKRLGDIKREGRLLTL